MRRFVETLLRWGGRVSSSLLLGLILVVVIGHGGPPAFLVQPPPVQVEMVAMLTISGGFILGWKWEGCAAALILSGFATFTLVEIVVNGSHPGGVMTLSGLPGVLFLLSSFMKVHRVNKDKTLH